MSDDDPALQVVRERQVRRMHLALIRATEAQEVARMGDVPDDYLLAQFGAGRPLAEALVDTIREQAT